MNDETESTGSASRRQRIFAWVLIARACIVILLGFSLLTTGFGRPILGNLLGMYWLVGSVVTLGWARANWGQLGSRLALVAGVAGVLAGLTAVTRLALIELTSANAVLNVLGVAAILMGLLRMSGLLRDEPRLARRSIRRAILGASEVALGVVWIAADGVSDIVITTGGWWGLFGGTLLLLDAVAAHRAPQAIAFPEPAP